MANPMCWDWVCMDLPGGKWNAPQSDEAKALMSERGKVLNEGAAMPLPKKVAHALKVIHKAYEVNPNGWAMSFGGGNDSMVLAHILCDVMRKDLPFTYSATRVDETCILKRVKYARERWGVVTVYPKFLPKEVWEKHGVPLFSKMVAEKAHKYIKTGNRAHLRDVPQKWHEVIEAFRLCGVRISHKCCDELKKKPLKAYDKSNNIAGRFTGVRCEESRARRLGWIMQGACYDSVSHRQWIATPLAFWTRADVKTYMAKHNLPYTESRSGCRNCPFGYHLEGAENKALDTLKEECPGLYEYTMEDMGLRNVLEIYESIMGSC